VLTCPQDFSLNNSFHEKNHQQNQFHDGLKFLQFHSKHKSLIPVLNIICYSSCNCFCRDCWCVFKRKDYGMQKFLETLHFRQTMILILRNCSNCLDQVTLRQKETFQKTFYTLRATSTLGSTAELSGKHCKRLTNEPTFVSVTTSFCWFFDNGFFFLYTRFTTWSQLYTVGLFTIANL